MQTAVQEPALLQASVVCALKSLHCALEVQAGVMQTLLQIILGGMQAGGVPVNSIAPLSQVPSSPRVLPSMSTL